MNETPQLETICTLARKSREHKKELSERLKGEGYKKIGKMYRKDTNDSQIYLFPQGLSNEYQGTYVFKIPNEDPLNLEKEINKLKSKTSFCETFEDTLGMCYAVMHVLGIQLGLAATTLTIFGTLILELEYGIEPNQTLKVAGMAVGGTAIATPIIGATIGHYVRNSNYEKTNKRMNKIKKDYLIGHSIKEYDSKIITNTIEGKYESPS